ncbi:hypothetical protein SAMN02910451_01852 [Butyrivibrio hungatei]|uniref:Uncharacterized protein n=1 Tax=Butyrivibrio hungatei TaxID=185008 RepID=A0A1G5E9W4_9FIRM|nr:DUF5688 family protein [Butyrivibrio hungatei]SCY23298.1 hypothetical protein SAMN02910451_01852 [Butyrivibrio hungatei]
MDYENFKEQFVEDVKEKLYEQGTEVDITVNTVNKLNESYEAMTVKPEDSNIGVNIGIDKFYGAVEDGTSYEDVVDKAVKVISDGFENRPQIDVASLTDYDQMKDKLVMEVVSAETNKEMLENVPHQNMEDMAVVYRFVLNSDDEGRASILATNQMIENMGVTPEQLHADALENAPRIKPAEIKGMGEVLAEMMGVEQAEMMGLYPVRPEDEQIFVASVPDKVHGAGVLAYQDFMDQAAERAGGDFYILPSSIHEILIVPDNGKMRLSDLENMVKEVNATQVAPADKLTDNVYHYDSQAKIFELGEKFVERQSERGEQDIERDEKESLLDDLKAKKEEVAKAPKKEAVEKAAKSKGGEAI